MSDFSFDELKKLIKEQLGGRFPTQLHEAEEEKPPGKGLIQFQKIAAAYKGFSQQEKAASLKRLAGKIQGGTLWEVVKNLAAQIKGNQIQPAQCPEDLIANLILLATLADLLFSKVAGAGSTRGWFMEEYLAGIAGGKVLTPNKSPGTADIEVKGELYSIKQTAEYSIAGSIPEFLFHYGYGMFVSPGDPKQIYFSQVPSTVKNIDYIHFLNLGDQKHVRAFLVKGEEIKDDLIDKFLTEAEGYPQDLMPAPRNKNPAGDSPVGPVLAVKEGVVLESKPLWPGVTKGSEEITFEIDLEAAVKEVEGQATTAFAQFNRIVNDFSNLTKSITQFYEEPTEATKAVAAGQTNVVEKSVNDFVARGCTPEETT
jgi:hypothetical protein